MLSKGKGAEETAACPAGHAACRSVSNASLSPLQTPTQAIFGSRSSANPPSPHTSWRAASSSSPLPQTDAVGTAAAAEGAPLPQGGSGGAGGRQGAGPLPAQQEGALAAEAAEARRGVAAVQQGRAGLHLQGRQVRRRMRGAGPPARRKRSAARARPTQARLPPTHLPRAGRWRTSGQAARTRSSCAARSCPRSSTSPPPARG